MSIWGSMPSRAEMIEAQLSYGQISGPCLLTGARRGVIWLVGGGHWGTSLVELSLDCKTKTKICNKPNLPLQMFNWKPETRKNVHCNVFNFHLLFWVLLNWISFPFFKERVWFRVFRALKEVWLFFRIYIFLLTCHYDTSQAIDRKSERASSGSNSGHLRGKRARLPLAHRLPKTPECLDSDLTLKWYNFYL